MSALKRGTPCQQRKLDQ